MFRSHQERSGRSDLHKTVIGLPPQVLQNEKWVPFSPNLREAASAGALVEFDVF